MPINNPSPGAHEIVTGQYTGDGAAARQIPLGFLPSLVVISAPASYGEWILIPNVTWGHGDTTPYHAMDPNTIPHATDGFNVSNVNCPPVGMSSNQNLNVFHYWAIST